LILQVLKHCEGTEKILFLSTRLNISHALEVG
jgi:hypothetical protein